jgi:hypothetical protein
VLVGGTCLSCLDPYAISCLPNNLSYSILCIPKYSVSKTYYSLCLPCSDNCLQCNVNGPGNCDFYHCMLGFIQLKGTLNCTACFNSCPVCDSNDLNVCLSCGPSRYSDGRGSCLTCSNKCRICSSASNCSICQLGYTLIDGYCL